MAQTKIVLRVDSQTDRTTDETRDSKELEFESYGLVLKAPTSRKVIPWHRVHEVIQQ